jgi:protein involved in temperature-dependent protein secretion
VRGLGQRTFLIGDEASPIMQLASLSFAPKAG